MVFSCMNLWILKKTVWYKLRKCFRGGKRFVISQYQYFNLIIDGFLLNRHTSVVGSFSPLRISTFAPLYMDNVSRLDHGFERYSGHSFFKYHIMFEIISKKSSRDAVYGRIWLQARGSSQLLVGVTWAFHLSRCPGRWASYYLYIQILLTRAVSFSGSGLGLTYSGYTSW